MQEKLTELQNEALAAAAEHIRGQRQKSINTKLVIASLTVILVVAIVCATVLGCTAITAQQETIREQQYALNMQYAGLSDLLYGAEIVTETIDAGEGVAIKVEGEGNITSGGDMNGENNN